MAPNHASVVVTSRWVALALAAAISIWVIYSSSLRSRERSRPKKFDGLPFDVHAAIFRHCSIKDLCSLRATSRTMKGLVDQRSVWYDVLADLLVVKPLPFSQSDLDCMSSNALREASVRLLRVSASFAKDGARPAHVHTRSNVDFTRVALLPGGSRYVAVTPAGEIRLYSVGLDAALAVLPSLPDSSNYGLELYPVSMTMSLVAQIVGWQNSPPWPTRAKTIKLQFRILQIEHTTLVPIYDFSLENEDGLGISTFSLYHEDGVYRLVYLQRPISRASPGYHRTKLGTLGIRTFYPSKHSSGMVEEHEVFVGLSDPTCTRPAGAVVVMLSFTRMLLAHPEGLGIFDLPSMTDVTASDNLVDLTPFWNSPPSRLTPRMGQPWCSVPIILRHGCPVPRARCLIWANNNLYGLDVPISGPNHEDIQHFAANIFASSLPHGAATGNSHVLMWPSRVMARSSLVTLVFGAGDEAGRMRLDQFRDNNFIVGSLSEQIMTQHCLDVRFDEVSGRMLWVQGSGRATTNLHVYDFVTKT